MIQKECLNLTLNRKEKESHKWKQDSEMKQKN